MDFSRPCILMLALRDCLRIWYDTQDGWINDTVLRKRHAARRYG
jgi:hypothetical protein